MEIKNEIKKEINELIDQGNRLLFSALAEFVSNHELDELTKEKRNNLLEERDKNSFSHQYHEWYAKSLEYVSVFLPSRKNDFIEMYRKKDAEKRKELTFVNYGIQDALHGLSKGQNRVNRSFGYTLFDQQLSILKSLIGVYESSINALLFEIQEQILDDEIASSRKLIKFNLRASGALAGVILERHLKIVCNSHSLVISKKDPTINDYNDCLKANNVIQVDVFRHIQYLGDLRNLCDHSKSSDPTLDNVTTLIDGVEKIIKTLY